jgi:DNA-binding response OmpR family regulator
LLIEEHLKKLLIIDDDLDLLEAMSLFLQQRNYHVVAISDAKEWRDTITEFEPDIIVLDVLLQEYDGRKISQEIKADKNFKHIPVVLISALSSDKVNYQKWNANGFIAKPFDIDVLNTTLQRLTS